MRDRATGRTERVFVWLSRTETLRLLRWARGGSVLATARSRALSRRVPLPRVDAPLVEEVVRLGGILTGSHGAKRTAPAFRADLDAALDRLEASIAAPPRYREPVPRERRAGPGLSRLGAARSRGVSIRLSPDEHDWLLAVCADYDLSRSRAFRLLAMGRALPVPALEVRLDYWLERTADLMFPPDWWPSGAEDQALKTRLDKAWQAFTRVGPIRHHKHHAGMDELMDYLIDSQKGRRRFLA